MNDTNTTLAELSELVADFVNERDWQQFHTPKNLAMAIASEAGELLEIYRWQKNRRSISLATLVHTDNELADVMILCIAMFNVMGTNATQMIKRKIKANARKYPIDEWKGKAR